MKVNYETRLNNLPSGCNSTSRGRRFCLTMANISVLKNGKAKAIRLSTLEAICRALEYQPGDILEYEE